MNISRRATVIHLLSVVVLVAPLASAPPAAQGAPRVQVPVEELFGSDASFGMAGNGVNTATGNFTVTETDLRSGNAVLALTRTYNSLDDRGGPLGPGWTLGFGASLTVAENGDVAFRGPDGRVLTFVRLADGGFRRPPGFGADLTRTGSGFALRYQGGVSWTFDVDGRLLARAVEGSRTILGYGDDGRLARVELSSGAELRFTHDDRGLLTEVAATDGRKVSYAYSADGLLESVTRPGGQVIRYTPTDRRITRVVDADEQVVLDIGYDERGRVRHQGYAGGGGADFAYSEADGTTTVTSQPVGGRLVHRHDRSGRLTALSDGVNPGASRTYDDAGQLIAASARGGTAATMRYDARGNLLERSVAGATVSLTYDSQDRPTAMTDPGGATTTYGYAGDSHIPSRTTDAAGMVTRSVVRDGLVVETVDALGNKTTYAYDDQRRLIAVTDPLGRTTRYEYDGSDRLTEVITPLGAATAFEYDAAGRVVARTDPLGGVIRYRYSAGGLLLSTTDEVGAVTTNGYDAAGRRTSTTDPLGRVTSFAYDVNGNLTATTDPGGAVSRYTYDGLGRLSTITDPAGTVTRYAYDADGRQTEHVQSTKTTVTGYDARGNVTSTTDALGGVTRYAYDAADRPVSVTDPTGAVSRTEYDTAGRVTARTDPTGARTTYRYDELNRLTAVVDALEHATRYGYDAASQLVTVTDPLDGVTRDAYDADGRLASRTTPAGLVTAYGYDAAGRRTSQTDPRGMVTSYTYSARGEELTTTTPGGAVRELRYDAAGQVIAAVDPNRAVTGYAYDAGGNLTALTDANGHVHRFTYDAAHRQTSSVDPAGRVTKQEFDGSGNLAAVTDPAGGTVRMEYDALDRLTRRTGVDGAEIRYGYDAVGRRTSMVDQTGTTRYTYDPAGRPLSATHPDGARYESRYDAAGRRTGLSYPSGLAVAFGYDAANRLVGVEDPKAGPIGYVLDPDGRALAEDLPGRWARRYSYDRGLLVRVEEDRENGPDERTAFGYDDDGRIVAETGRGPDRAYTYDPAGQLLSATGQRGGMLRATYDAVGNRTSLSRAAVTTSYRYDVADRLVAADTGPKHTEFRYDAAGRSLGWTSRNESQEITYDGFGRAATTTESRGGVTRTYAATYNGDDLISSLTATRAPGNAPPQQSAVGYHWGPGNASTPQILHQSGAAAADFVYGLGRVLADTGDSAAVFARDGEGSTVATPDTAPWAQGKDYDVFGTPEQAGTPAVVTPGFGYRGELSFGSTVYLRARYYDSDNGRFTSRDPVSTQVGQVDTVSLYAYANNDPVNTTDPTGKWAISNLLFNLIPSLASLLQHHQINCPPVTDDIERHDKCFQGLGPLRTRGHISKDCLNADQHCLENLYKGHQPERAAQAFAINELNRRREGWWDRFLDDQVGLGTTVSNDVDWEVGPRYDPMWTFRIDIVTDEKNIFEVKRWVGPSTSSEVDAQLGGYVAELAWQYNIYVDRGRELQDWADYFDVRDSWDDYVFLPDRVYVWGFENPPGHVYFAKDDKAPARVRAKADRQGSGQGKREGSSGIPIVPIIRVPIPVVV